MVDGVLHKECPVIAESSCIQRSRAPSGLVEEAHSGQFAEHFSKKRIYETLRKKSVMCADIRRHCHCSRSLVCVSCKGTSRTPHPPLQHISLSVVPSIVLGLTSSNFHWLRLATTVIIFLEYLMKLLLLPIKLLRQLYISLWMKSAATMGHYNIFYQSVMPISSV